VRGRRGGHQGGSYGSPYVECWIHLVASCLCISKCSPCRGAGRRNRTASPSEGLSVAGQLPHRALHRQAPALTVRSLRGPAAQTPRPRSLPALGAQRLLEESLLSGPRPPIARLWTCLPRMAKLFIHGLREICWVVEQGSGVDRHSAQRRTSPPATRSPDLLLETSGQARCQARSPHSW